MPDETKCPFRHTATTGEVKSIREWWPERLDLRILRQNSPRSDPMGEGFDYRKEFLSRISVRSSATFAC